MPALSEAADGRVPGPEEGTATVTPRRSLVALAAPAAVLLLCGAQSTSCEAPAGKPGAVKQVYVESNAPGWPMAAAVAEWRRAGVSRVHYGKCRKGAKCVKVTAKPIPGKISGQTDVLFGGGSIVLDSSQAWSARERREITVHELGHSLGALHNNVIRGQVWSCMNAHLEKIRTPCRITATDVKLARS